MHMYPRLRGLVASISVVCSVSASEVGRDVILQRIEIQ